jgi:hypothetical protein
MDLGACWQRVTPAAPTRQNFGTVPFGNSKEGYTFLACLWKGLRFSRPVVHASTAIGQLLGRSGLSPAKAITAAFDPGRAKTFSSPKNCTQPGAIDVDTTV